MTNRRTRRSTSSPSPATRRAVAAPKAVSRKSNRTLRLSDVTVPVDTRPYFLVVDMGTFCDHRLFDTAVKRLRNRYRLAYITTSNHKLPPSDIKLTYTIPQGMLEYAGEISTIMMEASFFGKVGKILKRYFRTGEALFTQILAMMNKLTTLIRKSIRHYQPKGLLVHSGCVAQVLQANRLHVPTSVLYFAPGFLPCREIPFAFDNALTEPETDVWNKDDKQVRANVHSGIRYHTELQNRMHKVGEKPFDHLARIQHLYTFDAPLVPPMTYADILPPLTVQSVGLMKPNLPTTPLDKHLAAWMRTCRRNGGTVVFVSFGSYLNNLAAYQTVKNGPTALELFLTALHQYVDGNNAHLLLHDDKQCIPAETMQHIDATLPRIRVHTSFVAYPTLVPKCAMVCFTGSVCLQNICWQHKTPMLYVPVLPEQYLWAKLYRKHTGVPFVDYQRDDLDMMAVAVKRAFAWTKTKGATTLFERVKKTIPRDAGYEVVRCIEEWGKRHV